MLVMHSNKRRLGCELSVLFEDQMSVMFPATKIMNRLETGS